MKINHILISQPAPAEPGKSPFSGLVDKYKVKLDFMPFIQTEAVTTKEFRHQHIDILAYTAVIFTNRTNIDIFFRICDECRIVIPETMKYFCVSEAVALYLQKYIVYRKRKIFFGKSKFIDLMEVLAKHAGEKFLIPMSDSQSSEVPRMLDEAKLNWEKVILSRTINANLKDRLKISDYDLLLFYSPAEVASLLENFGEEAARNIRIAAFGVNTAKAVSDAGLQLVAMAPTSESPSMVMAVDKYMTELKKGSPADTAYIKDTIHQAALENQQVLAKVKTTKPRRTAVKNSSK